MGHGLLHQSNTPGRIGAILARGKNSRGGREKVELVECGVVGDVRGVLPGLLYLEIRRGTQVAQGRGLQNLHSWVRIPPAPPALESVRALVFSVYPACTLRLKGNDWVAAPSTRQVRL